MVNLETERLILRNYNVTDFQDVYEYFSRDEVAEYEDFYPMSEDEVRELIDEWKDKDNRLVAELKNSGKVIGSIGYWIDEDDDYSIDFDFNPDYGKKGYATEAGLKLLDYMLNNLGADEVYGDCDIRNENSWKLLERLGFERIAQKDDASYKDDNDGKPIVISIFIYKRLRNNRLLSH